LNIFQRQLNLLAGQYGVQTVYHDVFGKRRQASPDSILKVLKGWGALLETEADVPKALRESQLRSWQRVVQPVAVAWDGRLAQIELQLPTNKSSSSLYCRLHLEQGETQDWKVSSTDLSIVQRAKIGKLNFVAKTLKLPHKLPFGYHRLLLKIGKQEYENLIIAAPQKAYPNESREKLWGIFVPLYALRSENSWGSGVFSDLGILSEWVNSLGGDAIATLPFYAAFLDKPFEYSPYLPASKLFWNEFYLDLRQIPEFKACRQAQELLAASKKSIESLNRMAMVDYRKGAALKRRILEKLARYFFSQNSASQRDFWRFLKSNPEVQNYASFRAALEKQGKPWPEWPPRLREGRLKSGDYNQEDQSYHLYVQWQAQRQLKELAEAGRKSGTGLYLDFPLGVHPYGYDVWRYRDQFVQEVSVGAPPDAFFTKGQDWKFPPLSPEKMRSDQYRYFRACLQNAMQFASFLRIDHVMGLHRQFWIPEGMGPEQGVYVSYPAEELYAILCLESHQHKTVIVGEDLGTVPAYVRTAMQKHNFLRMSVAEFVSWAESMKKNSLRKNVVASLNTHDMPTFAALWKSLDIKERTKMELLSSPEAKEEWRHRLTMKQNLVKFLKKKGWLKGNASIRDILKAVLRFLAASPARLALINLEDLWLETRPQNIPGTGKERPNWKRKARYNLEIFTRMPGVMGILKTVDSLRKRNGKAKNK